MPYVLIDANVLVGALDPSDRLHARSLEALKLTTKDIVTTWPVVAEASHFLSRRGRSHQDALLALIADKELSVAELTSVDIPRVRDLMSKYRDQPMDLADATLLRVAERDGIDTIMTLDRDFLVYRAAGIGALKILPKP